MSEKRYKIPISSKKLLIKHIISVWLGTQQCRCKSYRNTGKSHNTCRNNASTSSNRVVASRNRLQHKDNKAVDRTLSPIIQNAELFWHWIRKESTYLQGKKKFCGNARKFLFIPNHDLVWARGRKSKLHAKEILQSEVHYLAGNVPYHSHTAPRWEYTN